MKNIHYYFRQKFVLWIMETHPVIFNNLVKSFNSDMEERGKGHYKLTHYPAKVDEEE